MIQLGNSLVNQNLFLPLPAVAAAAILPCGLVLDLSPALGAAEDISGCGFGGSLTLEIWKVVWRYHFPLPSFEAFLNCRTCLSVSWQHSESLWRESFQVTTHCGQLS